MRTPLNINDYTYPLPQERIALFPLEERDHSKLLVYRKGIISHQRFMDIGEYIPQNSLLVFNNTRVIQARLLFAKESGASIEVFLLNPVYPSPLLIDTMQAVNQCTWKCTIGNLKRWTTGLTLTMTLSRTMLEAVLDNRETGEVTFRWTGDQTFAEIIQESGNTPLPPYLKRKAVDEDRERYQTIYSKFEGAVAAPTAGLHFTPRVFDTLSNNHISKDFLTLHVSAGTFQPVKEADATKHVMHEEQIVVSKANIETLLKNAGHVIPVGTTSMRTLESLYWFGVKLLCKNGTSFFIAQNDAYTLPDLFSAEESLDAVLRHFNETGSESITGETAIYIRPGYRFRICNGLITNFHQPASTLILLVAAFIGDDWRKVYQEALDHNYRFLSYGDSSLLLP